MTVIALRTGLDMGRCFSGCARPVVTTAAGARRNTAVIEQRG